MTIDISDYKGKTVHFIGIGGSSMNGLARLMKHMGYHVRGSDSVHSHTVEKLEKEGMQVAIGHRAENVHGADFVVYTAAIAEDNVEREECRRLGIPQMERAELLGEIANAYKNVIAVCGTHGKTSVTAMLASILIEAEVEPTIHIGGELPRIGGSVLPGKDDFFVTEACEFKASFLTLYPHMTLVLNVDADHLDFYKDIEEIQDTFAKFVSQIHDDGYLIVCADNERAYRLVQDKHIHPITYGLQGNWDYTADELEKDENACYSFRVLEHGKELGHIAMHVPGIHHVLNALGVIAAARNLGIGFEAIEKGLDSFHGVHRRFELTGVVDGVKLYHDYGHNPAEFKTVIPIAAEMHHHKLYVVCQPHTYSRTKALFQDYLTCFDGADEVLVTDIYAAREKDPGDIHSTMLVKAMLEKGVPAVYTPTFADCKEYLKKNWQEDDIVLTLGCGNINLLNEELEKD
ncbi:MAG: UDP-N-acetylmuramate--L-alanine ligase [Clostridia bacterium]|nr:UDP-N-acetylmuramate--L-alanine ligase [Clostridia bacterium]